MLIIYVIFCSALVSWNGLVTASNKGGKYTLTNINTSEIEKVAALPIIILVNPFDIVFLNNTGHSAQLNVDESVSGNIVILGPIGSQKFFVYAKTIFYWTKSTEGPAYITVNGRFGTALEIHIIYYNVKYGSFNNALKHSDGLFIITYRIKVGLLRNPLFDLFAPYFEKIREPGSSVRLVLAPAFLFYVIPLPTNSYFRYHGSYVDESTGKAYDCATYFVTPLLPIHFISEKQFGETFLSLSNSRGGSLTNSVERIPQGRTKVQQSTGLLKIPNLLFSVPTRFQSQ